ncbi:MAG: phosphoenolpyruvate carboxylase, partial [Pelagibacterales bacterium]|nr:phosphoenolpyruvate carboxylase [Pelagibacterales bacterium]
GEAAGDFSGYSVSLSSDGTTVAIGANLNDGTAAGAGHVRIYQYNGSAWTKLGNDIDGEAGGDESGYSVSLSSDGTTVAIGAKHNNGTAINAGHVRVYNLVNQNAPVASNVSAATVKNTNASIHLVASDEDFDTLTYSIVSNPSNGSVNLSGATVTYTPTTDFSGTDTFTFKANDGTVDSTTKTVTIKVIDGYKTTQNLLGSDIDGEAANDYSGTSVSFNEDNTIMAIGAAYNDGRKLRNDIIKNYYRDIRKLRRRLTFKNIEAIIIDLETRLYESILDYNEDPKITLNELKKKLYRVREILISEHKSLFLDQLDDVIIKVNIFGYHFATLDIRQDSRIHSKVFERILEVAQQNKIINKPISYDKLTVEDKIKFLSTIKGDLNPDSFKDNLVNSTLSSIRAMKLIQRSNGEKGSNRYIISNNQSALNIIELFTMFRLSNWSNPSIDVVPLFETISDLKVAAKVMESVYLDRTYRNHLKNRGDKQTIMLGFSDGTKDGGYLMANWSILRAKESLTTISRKYGIKVLFFDGRGGPPARGGGNTHQFYASMGEFVESDQIQLTVQGQTISSNFGTVDSCKYNLEQLLSAGIQNRVLNYDVNHNNKKDRIILDNLAKISFKAYSDFKNHPKFVPYLEHMSTIKYYSKTNIGSRPLKRGKYDSKFDFKSLRAIPFVGSWSQLKQNVPGFYGLGSALKYYDDNKKFNELKKLYKRSPFFRTLISNSMMSLTKSFFQLTSYMKDDPEFGEFWLLIYNEYKLSKSMILKLSGFKELMENEPANKASIQTREKIVLPLITIQQYALRKIKEIERGTINKNKLKTFEKMVTRSLFGNINASRNSA